MKLYYLILSTLIGLCHSYGQGQQMQNRHGQQGQFNNDVPITHLQPTIPHYSGSGSLQGFDQHNVKSVPNNYSPFQMQGPQYNQGGIYNNNPGKGSQFGFDSQNSRDFDRGHGQGHTPEYHQQDFDVRRNNPSFNHQNVGFNQQNTDRYRPGFQTQQNFGSSRHDQFNSREYGQNVGPHPQQGFDRRYDSQTHQHRPHRQPHYHY